MSSRADKKKPNGTPNGGASTDAFDFSALRQAIPGPGEEVLPRDPEAGVKEEEKVTVVFLCEQTSHHPPISAAYYYCPERGIEAVGVDQILAKVSFPCESRRPVHSANSTSYPPRTGSSEQGNLRSHPS
jgi:hypothetical protein